MGPSVSTCMNWRTSGILRLEEFLGRADFGDYALGEHGDSVGNFKDLRDIMADDDAGEFKRVVHFADQLMDAFSQQRIQGR